MAEILIQTPVLPKKKKKKEKGKRHGSGYTAQADLKLLVSRYPILA
jgi:hypothetical protein